MVPPSGFGYPLDGLLPPKPGRACLIPTAFLGFSPSKRSPLTRWLMRFRNCRTCLPLARRDLPQVNLRTGAENTDFQALALARVPCRQRVINPPPAGGSLGVAPFQGCSTGHLVRASARNAPHALPPLRRMTKLPCASGYRSATDWPDSKHVSEPTRMSQAALLGFPCQLTPAD